MQQPYRCVPSAYNLNYTNQFASAQYTAKKVHLKHKMSRTYIQQTKW